MSEQIFKPGFSMQHKGKFGDRGPGELCKVEFNARPTLPLDVLSTSEWETFLRMMERSFNAFQCLPETEEEMGLLVRLQKLAREE